MNNKKEEKVNIEKEIITNTKKYKLYSTLGNEHNISLTTSATIVALGVSSFLSTYMTDNTIIQKALWYTLLSSPFVIPSIGVTFHKKSDDLLEKIEELKNKKKYIQKYNLQETGKIIDTNYEDIKPNTRTRK